MDVYEKIEKFMETYSIGRFYISGGPFIGKSEFVEKAHFSSCEVRMVDKEGGACEENGKYTSDVSRDEDLEWFVSGSGKKILVSSSFSTRFTEVANCVFLQSLRTKRALTSRAGVGVPANPQIKMKFPLDSLSSDLPLSKSLASVVSVPLLYEEKRIDIDRAPISPDLDERLISHYMSKLSEGIEDLFCYRVLQTGSVNRVDWYDQAKKKRRALDVNQVYAANFGEGRFLFMKYVYRGLTCFFTSRPLSATEAHHVHDCELHGCSLFPHDAKSTHAFIKSYWR